jgi:hypothetical protein
MAKKFYKAPKHSTGRVITTKTPYGSTSDMIVTDAEILKKVSVAEFCVLLKDDDGYYITNKNRIDSGLADPLRYCETYRKIMSEKIQKDFDAWEKYLNEQANKNDSNDMA